MREYLAALAEVNDPPQPFKAVSLTDPAASWANRGGPSFFAYSTNYLIDLKAGIIVDVEPSAVSKAAEVTATRKMIERVEDRFDLKPERLVGDTNYGAAALLGWLVDGKRIEPHVPVCDKTERQDGTLSSSAFVWQAQKTNTVARQASHCVPTGAPSIIRARILRWRIRSSTAAVSLTARHAR